MKKRGKIIVIVAPSGTGKSTLLSQVKEDISQLVWSISCTTRPQRAGEVDGKDYFFITTEDFEQKLANDEFVEWAKVHNNYYGTLKSFVDEGLESGKMLLFDLDVQGCDSIRKIYPDDTSIIFIEPPSVEELEMRLRKRATDDTGTINLRLFNAKKELERKNDYDFNVVNDDFERAFCDLKKIITSLIEG